MDREILTEYVGCLMKAALYRCGNTEDARDLVQDTLLAALSLREKPDDLKAWLMAVLTRKFNDLLRRRYKKPVVCIDTVGEIPNEDENLVFAEKNEERERIRQCVAQLAEIHRNVIVRYYFRNESVKEIAAALGISESAVKSRLFAGREHIRKEFDMESYEKNSYEPETLYISCTGKMGMNDEPYSLVGDDRIKMNLLLLAYRKPLTITELSKAIGIAAAYIEPLVNGLVNGGLMKRTSDKVYTDFPIYSPEDRAGTIALDKQISERLWADIWAKIHKGLADIRKKDFYRKMSPSACQKAEAYSAVKILCAVLGDIRNSAGGETEKEVCIPDRPNGGKWYAMGSFCPGGHNYFKEIHTALERYCINGNSDSGLEDICGLAELRLSDFDTSLGRSYTAWNCKSEMRFPSWSAAANVMKTLWAVHTGDENMLSAISCAPLEELEKNGFIARDGKGKRILDIPVITAEERRELEQICGDCRRILTEKFGGELKSLFAKPLKIPPHLEKSVPVRLRLMYCANTFVMRVVYNAIDSGKFLAGYDKSTPCPAVILSYK